MHFNCFGINKFCCFSAETLRGQDQARISSWRDRGPSCGLEYSSHQPIHQVDEDQDGCSGEQDGFGAVKQYVDNT